MMKTLEEIKNIAVNSSNEAFEKLTYWYYEWLFGSAPKARVNYWLKKVGLTLEEWELWESTI